MPSILDTVGGYWEKNFTSPREDDDQGLASSMLSTDSREKTTFRQRRVKTKVHSLRYRRRISRNDDVSIKARQKTTPAQGKRAPAQGRLGRRPGSSILDTVAGYWGENVTLRTEDDDQGAASSILSTDIEQKASFYLGKTTTRVQHPRCCRRILGRKRHFTKGRRRPGSSILDAIDGYWTENVTFPREDDDQGLASSMLSTDIEEKTAFRQRHGKTRV